MGRKEYLQVILVLIATIITAALAVALWCVMFIPVMLYPQLVGGLKPVDKFTEVFTRRMIKNSVKQSRKANDPHSPATTRSFDGPSTG